MSKIFVEPKDIHEEYIYIYNQEDINHIIKVLRLSENDIIIVGDGNGQDYKACIETIDKKVITAKKIEKKFSHAEPLIDVTLYQGIPKSSKMEYIIQKTTELGINRIVPVMTKRTIVKLDAKATQNKLQRWQRVAYEAAKQSKRGKIPAVSLPVDFEQALQEMRELDMSLIPYEKEEKNNLKQILCNPATTKTKIGVFIGPEGGFEEKEIQRALQLGIYPVTLGPRILRTETAGMATLAVIMYELGGNENEKPKNCSC